MAQVIRALQKLSAVILQCVSSTKLEQLRDDLVHSYQYLGCRKLLGRRLKYMAFVQDKPLAALAWSAPALQFEVGDLFIGWSQEMRAMYLNRLAANSRFVIFLWVDMPNLGSYLLAKNLKRLRSDWKNAFEQDLWLVESFVDPRYFTGTVYKVSNWIYLGSTKGYTKKGQSFVYHGRTKDVYVYVLEPHLDDREMCSVFRFQCSV